MLLLHILIAIASLAVTGLAYIKPSQSTLRVAYGFIAGTFASGTLLVLTAPAHLPTACISGLLYSGVVVFGIITARRRFAHQTQKIS